MDHTPSHFSSTSGVSITLLILTPIFLFGTLGIDVLGWMKNNLCNPYFGCDSGFFGYDAFMHFLGGILLVTIVLWLIRKYQILNLFGENHWKNFFILISTVMFIEIGWELMEFALDNLRIGILNHIIPPQMLAQPSNADSMGDLFFSSIGAIGMAGILKYSYKKTV